MLIGFIDGDGYISITKTTKGFITIKLVISLHINDLSTLQYIQSILKLGKIYIYNKHNTCVLIINRTDLQKYFIPLLLYHNLYFLTITRRKQFDKLLFILKNDIKLYNNLPNFIPSFNLLPITSEDYLNIPFFKNWLVGFTMAEGSFFFKKNNDACFQLHHIEHSLLFESFNLIFLSDRKILIESNPNSKFKYKYNLFSLSSKKDIQQVINFFSLSGNHPLIGLKLINYQNWLNKLKESKRYCNLNIPIY